jgi:hypothetical protein
MIGITRFARFAGLAALPAILPAFAKAAWLSVLPEFNTIITTATNGDEVVERTIEPGFAPTVARSSH